MSIPTSRSILAVMVLATSPVSRATHLDTRQNANTTTVFVTNYGFHHNRECASLGSLCEHSGAAWCGPAAWF